MYLLPNCFSRILFAFMALIVSVAVSSCSDNIDESNLYVFSGQSVTDFVKQQPELSKYLVLLKKARSGMGRGSTMDHMLESRGNYTCFIPTDDAIQEFVDSVENRRGFDVNNVSDSLAQVIVFNSIIDNGDIEAYKSTDFQGGCFATEDHGGPIHSNKFCSKRQRKSNYQNKHVLAHS